MTESQRTVLLTGATSGLGRELAARLSGDPGHLILQGRSAQKLEALRGELEGAQAQVDTVTADLADQAQVHQLAADVADLTDQLHVLVNNAGLGKGAHDARELSDDGFELRLAVNHLAPFALTLRLLPLLQFGAPSRIVNVASGAQQPVDFEDLHLEEGYTGSRAYAQSKFAMVTAGFTLSDTLAAEAVTVNSLHPATLMPTPLVEEGYGHTVDDLATGAAATMRLISSPELEGVTGRYYSIQEQASASPEAYDPQVQRKLWKISEELTRTELSTAQSASRPVT